MNITRGSTWAKWDLHVHSPASYNWAGNQALRKLHGAERDAVIAEWVRTMNDSDVAVFAVMDYWTFDGYIALREYLTRHPGALHKTVLPGIELRVQSPTEFRLNIHAILSEELPDQLLRDFVSKLEVQPINGQCRPLSPDCLRQYVRSLRDDQLAKHGIKRDTLNDDDRAWLAGSDTCEVTLESFRKAMRFLPDEMAVVFQPWNTYNGLIELKWANHYTSAYQLFSQPDIFECKTRSHRDAFVGLNTADNEGFFDAFWEALGRRPRLPVRGSDAHTFAKYGKFQSALPTWIKAAPTFRGLLQAIKEPLSRSWLGELPPKLEKVASKPSVFIDQLVLRKTADSKLSTETWFAGQTLLLNADLVAVIGSKGSGKSALADIAALLGDTGNAESFSFLTSHRFRDRKFNRSQHFEGEIVWANAKSTTRRLSDNPPEGAVERVRYVPQAYFERVCSGQSESDLAEFTGQIERVIFSYVPADLKGPSTDLRGLLTQQEAEANRKLDQLRAEVRALNDRILDERRRANASAKAELSATLDLRRQQLIDLQAAEPPLPALPPADDPKAQLVLELEARRQVLRDAVASEKVALAAIQESRQAATAVSAALAQLRKHVDDELARLQTSAELASINLSKVVEFKYDEASVAQRLKTLTAEADEQQAGIDGPADSSLASQIAATDKEIESARAQLSNTQLATQLARTRHAQWKEQLESLAGAADLPTSIAFVEAQVANLDAAPARIASLQVARDQKCLELATEIYGIKSAREKLVAVAGKAIEAALPKKLNVSLEFLNQLVVKALDERLFEIVKQVSGTFRGEEEGRRKLHDFIESKSMNTPKDLASFASSLEHALLTEERDSGTVRHDIEALVRKGRTAKEALDLVYCLEYIQPRFTLAHGGQPLTQLSPGQRGALLLTFFLLVEDTDIPIVLDQPEENLDNETVFTLLVPAIREAKLRRQIIMVTHNANLGVCCDAEQVIHASLDRANGRTVTYRCGPIEDPGVNRIVVDVLEGTRPAFDNRREKYQDAV